MIHWQMFLPHQVPAYHTYQIEKKKVENFKYYSEQQFRQVTNKNTIQTIHQHMSLPHQVHAYH